VPTVDQVRLSRVKEFDGLCAVNYLGQHVVEECILDIKLVGWPIPWESKGQDNVNYHGLHNRAKGLIVIDAEMMREPVKNASSLAPLECPIGLELVLEDPLVRDNIGATGARNQVTSVVGHESGILFLHSHPPMRIGEGGPN
jgi:hypothetical protein